MSRKRFEGKNLRRWWWWYWSSSRLVPGGRRCPGRGSRGSGRGRAWRVAVDGAHPRIVSGGGNWKDRITNFEHLIDVQEPAHLLLHVDRRHRPRQVYIRSRVKSVSTIWVIRQFRRSLHSAYIPYGGLSVMSPSPTKTVVCMAWSRFHSQHDS